MSILMGIGLVVLGIILGIGLGVFLFNLATSDTF